MWPVGVVTVEMVSGVSGGDGPTGLLLDQVAADAAALAVSGGRRPAVPVRNGVVDMADGCGAVGVAADLVPDPDQPPQRPAEQSRSGVHTGDGVIDGVGEDAADEGTRVPLLGPRQQIPPSSAGIGPYPSNTAAASSSSNGASVDIVNPIVTGTASAVTCPVRRSTKVSARIWSTLADHQSPPKARACASRLAHAADAAATT